MIAILKICHIHLKKINIFILGLIFIQINPAFTQNSAKELFSVFLTDGLPNQTNTGTFSFTNTYSNSGSHWEIDWSETYVFSSLFKYEDASNPNQSYELRFGKGGQVYSFKSAFGEALPPQWRPSYDTNGKVVSDNTPSIVNGQILPEKGNWAPWVDEVWQMVNTDANDALTENNTTSVVTRNIHQAGSYLNNYAHRSSDLITPFYSPIIAEDYDAAKQEYSMIIWPQSESPNYVYDGRSDCNPCHQDVFRANSIYYFKYKNIGNGIIQVDFLSTNFSKTRETNFFNIPFIGIRYSNLKYLFLSNTDNSYYQETIPDFSSGTTIRSSLTNGWFAVSNSNSGTTPALGFVFDKNTVGYSDFRYGTALGNSTNIRDATILSYRLLKSNNNHWNLINTKTFRGRYYIVVDATVQNIADKIASNNLVSKAKTVRKDFTLAETETLYYNITFDATNGFTATQTTQELSNLSVKSKPFLNSNPVFLINNSNGEARLSNNPYYYSIRPYDGTVKSIKIIGYSENPLDANPATLSTNDVRKKINKVYPNPAKNQLNIEHENKFESTIKLYTLLGQELKVNYHQKSPSKINIDLTSITKGVYFLNIDDEKIKIIKQ